MQLDKKRNVVGQKVWFSPAGTTISENTVSATFRPTKPGAQDNGWVDLGCVESMTPNPSVDREVVKCFVPGSGYVDSDEIITGKELTFDLVTNSLSALAVDLLFLGKIVQPNANSSSPITYTPGSSDGKLLGWLYIPQYLGVENTAFNELQVWVSLQLKDGFTLGNEVPKPSFTGRLLQSSLNTGTLTGLAWNGVPVTA